MSPASHGPSLSSSNPPLPTPRQRHYRAVECHTRKDDGGGRDAEEQILIDACRVRVVDDGRPTTDHRTRLLLWELVMNDGSRTGNCPPRGGCILFSTAPTPNLNVLHAPCCCPAADPARISTSRAHGRVSLARPAVGSWNRSPLFRCFWELGIWMKRGAGQLRLAAAGFGGCCAGEHRPLHRSESASSFTASHSSSSPARSLCYCTLRGGSVCVSPRCRLPRQATIAVLAVVAPGFPASCSWFRLLV